MNRFFTLFLIAFTLFFAPGAASSAEVPAAPSVTTTTVKITKAPFGYLIKKGKYDVVQVRVTPADQDDQAYGPQELLLVNLGEEFGDVSEVQEKLTAKGLVPASYRELLEYVAQMPRTGTNDLTIIALGSETELPNGTRDWQCVCRRNGKWLLLDVVQGDEWPANFSYLAKRMPTKRPRLLSRHAALAVN